LPKVWWLPVLGHGVLPTRASTVSSQHKTSLTPLPNGDGT